MAKTLLSRRADPVWPMADNAAGEQPLPAIEARRVALDAVPPAAAGRRTVLRFEGVRHAAASFTVRVFFDAPDADATTPVHGNDRFAAIFYMYGHGPAAATAVHPVPSTTVDAQPPPLRGLAPFDTMVDVTAALGRRPDPQAPLTVTLVVVNPHGEPLEASLLRFDRMLLAAER